MGRKIEAKKSNRARAGRADHSEADAQGARGDGGGGEVRDFLRNLMKRACDRGGMDRNKIQP